MKGKTKKYKTSTTLTLFFIDGLVDSNLEFGSWSNGVASLSRVGKRYHNKVGTVKETEIEYNNKYTARAMLINK